MLVTVRPRSLSSSASPRRVAGEEKKSNVVAVGLRGGCSDPAREEASSPSCRVIRVRVRIYTVRNSAAAVRASEKDGEAGRLKRDG